LANGGRGRQQDDLAAGIVSPPPLQVEAGGCSGAIAIDGQGRAGIAASRAVANLKRRALGNGVRGVARLALDLERARIDGDGAGEGAGTAEREVSGARFGKSLRAGNDRADDIGCVLDRNARRPAADSQPQRPARAGAERPVVPGGRAV
jgi:hypothetical protein